MGVISLTSLKSGLCFGPIPTALMIADPAYLIGNMTRDAFPEIPNTRVNLLESMEMHRLIEWVPYLRSARHPEEQNLELLREQNGDIFYRVSRSVETGDELLIWFSKEYCKQIGIPDIKELSDTNYMTKEGDPTAHFCSECGAKFIYPYPFVCHKMFKCRFSRSATTSVVSQVNNNNNEELDLSLSNTSKETHKNNLKRFHSDEDGQRQHNEFSSLSAFKKIPKIQSSGNMNDFLKMNSLMSTDHEAILAPFLKTFASAHYSAGLSINPAMYNLANESPYIAPGIHPNTFFPYAPTSNYGSVTPAQYLQIMSKSIGLPVAGSNTSTSEYFSNQKLRTSTDKTRHTSSSSPNGTNGHATQISQPQKVTNPMVEKLLQSAVLGESILGNQSLGINQNWCAKCNATFRMTSDLVYHMRTHHQRELGSTNTQGNSGDSSDSQQSRKRCEYLRCEICGETFRERHHLTRHMTSHD